MSAPDPNRTKSLLVVGALSQVSRALLCREGLIETTDSIVLLDHPQRESELHVLAGDVRAHTGRPVVTVSVDVRDEASVDAAFAAPELKALTIARALYAAGVNYIRNPFQVAASDYDRLMETNLRGFFFVARHLASGMMRRGGGSIVAIASQHGVRPGVDRAVYSASKAGLIMLVKALAIEWAAYDIRLNTVSPTLIASEDNRGLTSHQAFSEAYRQKIPLHRFAVPDDVAEAIAFLLADSAAMMTGQNLLVDGGWTIGP